MLEFSPAIARAGNEVCRVLLAQHIECFFEPALLDEAVSRQISTRGVPRDQVLFGEKALGSSIVSGGEMDLGEPEGIFVVFWPQISRRIGRGESRNAVLVNASSLSPMKMADSY